MVRRPAQKGTGRGWERRRKTDPARGLGTLTDAWRDPKTPTWIHACIRIRGRPLILRSPDWRRLLLPASARRASASPHRPPQGPRQPRRGGGSTSRRPRDSGGGAPSRPQPVCTPGAQYAAASRRLQAVPLVPVSPVPPVPLVLVPPVPPKLTKRQSNCDPPCPVLAPLQVLSGGVGLVRRLWPLRARGLICASGWQL